MLDLSLGELNEILVLGAHCDDIEIGCGGTLLHLIGKHPGVRIHWVIFSSDEDRSREAEAAARDFSKGADLKLDIQNFRNGYFPFVGSEIKDHFESLKQKVDPDLIFTHHRADRHQDHRTVSELTWNTFRDHLILEYEIPKYDGDLGNPNFYVPLSGVEADRKIQSLLAHYESQSGRQWFDAETFMAILRLRGVEANAANRYAEAFHAPKVRLV